MVFAEGKNLTTNVLKLDFECNVVRFYIISNKGRIIHPADAEKIPRRFGESKFPYPRILVSSMATRKRAVGATTAYRITSYIAASL